MITMNNQDEINKCRRLVREGAMKDAIQQLYNTCLDIAFFDPHYVHYIKPLSNALGQDGVPNPKMFAVLCRMSDHIKIEELVAKLAAE